MPNARNLARILLASVAAAAPLTAQSHDHDDMAGMRGMTPSALSPKARREIDSVAKSVAGLGAPGAAASAGFRPVFGWIPTMGEHWIDRALMSKDKQADRRAPSNLMFSKIGGKDSLVGAAYAYFAPENDSTPPALFDGSPMWHEHPNLAPPGQRLVMLHVWFVTSPDGPFAGTNPNLPFWALGLAAPDAARMRDSSFAATVRRASLALAEVTDTTAIFPNLENRPNLKPVLAARRDSIRALVPEFRAAERARDAARWERVAAKAAAQWDGIYAAYLGSAVTAAGKQRMERFVEMLLGQHHE
jgi:hypothetical protein